MSTFGAPGGALTNDVVIAWLRSGVSEAEILTRIKRSSLNYFDASPSALYRLSQAGASRAVIDAMRSRNRQQRGILARRDVMTALTLLIYSWPLLVR